MVRFYTECIILVLCLWSVGTVSLKNTASCNRIILTHPHGKLFHFSHLFHQIYIKTSWPQKNGTGLSVYRNERGGVFFVYGDDQSRFYFGDGDVDEKNLFYIHQGQIKINCVNFTDCPNEFMIILMNKQRKQEEMVRFHFQRIPGVHKGDRHVYRDSSKTSNISLFYNKHHKTWYIYDTLHQIQFQVNSNSLKPEFIQETWKSSTRATKEFVSKVKCTGHVTMKGNCLNKGSRHRDSSGKYWCLCRYGFTGGKCQTKIKDHCPPVLEVMNKTKKNKKRREKNEDELMTLKCGNDEWRVIQCIRNQNKKLVWLGGNDCNNENDPIDPMLPLKISKKKPKHSSSTSVNKPSESEKSNEIDSQDILSLILIIGPIIVMLHTTVHLWLRKCLPPISMTLSQYAYFGE